MTVKKSRVKKDSSPTSFLLKRGDKFFMVPKEIVEAFTADEAFRLGFIAHLEQRAVLLEDAYNGDSYIDKVKVVDGLESSLKKLNEMFPFLREQISRVEAVSIYSKTGKC